MNSKSRTRSAQDGYTMTELVGVLALVGILWAAGVPRIPVFLSSYDLSNAADSLAGSIRLARMRAITANTRARVVVNSGGYVVQRESPRGSRSYVDDGAPQPIPNAVRISLPTVPTFDSRGLAVAPARIMLTGPGGSTKTITVNGIGRVAVN